MRNEKGRILSYSLQFIGKISPKGNDLGTWYKNYSKWSKQKKTNNRHKI